MYTYKNRPIPCQLSADVVYTADVVYVSTLHFALMHYSRVFYREIIRVREECRDFRQAAFSTLAVYMFMTIPVIFSVKSKCLYCDIDKVLV